MGIDCKIWLPGNVRVRDVAVVIGIAAGFKPKKAVSGDAWWAEVEECKAIPNPHLASCCEINLKGKAVDDYDGHFVLYHFEPGSEDGMPAGQRLLMPRSTAFWIGVGKKLIDFFGGTLDYNDCDESYADYVRVPGRDSDNCPTTGQPWEEFQTRLMAVEAITKDELEQYAKFASY